MQVRRSFTFSGGSQIRGEQIVEKSFPQTGTQPWIIRIVLSERVLFNNRYFEFVLALCQLQEFCSQKERMLESVRIAQRVFPLSVNDVRPAIVWKHVEAGVRFCRPLDLRRSAGNGSYAKIVRKATYTFLQLGARNNPSSISNSTAAH